MDRYKEFFRIDSTRLRTWDYSNPSWYYVTLNVRNHREYFGDIRKGKMCLNEFGSIAEMCWKGIPVYFGNAAIDYFVVMPNHVHGIIIIESKDVACNVSTDNPEKNVMSKISPLKGSLSAIVRSYKSAVSKLIHDIGGNEFSWQSRFFERIIRNEQELFNIRQYIEQNPFKWSIEKENDEFIFDK